MCVVSAIGDNYGRDFPWRWPDMVPQTVPYPGTNPSAPGLPGFPFKPRRQSPYKIRPEDIIPPASQEDVDKLRKEVEELKELLKAGKKFDDATGQKDCEIDDKVALLKKIAEIVGVDLSEVFGEAK